MSLDYFPVAFYDEASIWEHFSAQINSRLPIYGVNLNLPEGDILMPPLPIKFISHTESFWHEDLEFTYKRPYLWIFILKFTNFEIFKRDIKPKLKELVSQMQKWTIEWLVVFVPSFTRLVKSDHKNFLASFSKVQNEVLTMTGKQNVTKFYCMSNKTFVDLSQPSCIKDEYWLDFIKSVGKGVSIGIQTAICTHLKASCLHMDQSFELYSLNLYALGLLYEAIGVKNQSCFYLEMIREIVFVSKLVHSYKNDFLQDLELNGEEFERFLIKSEMSKVWCLRYLTDGIVNFLNLGKLIEKSAWTANNSLEILWSLYKLTPCLEFLKFIYFYSDRFQVMFFSLMNGK